MYFRFDNLHQEVCKILNKNIFTNNFKTEIQMIIWSLLQNDFTKTGKWLLTMP